VIKRGDVFLKQIPLSDLGVGTKEVGQMEIKVLPGKEIGKFIVTLKYK
jgi:hypothetical protein